MYNPPFGMRQPAPTLLFLCYTLLPFRFYWRVLPWIRHLPTLPDCRFDSIVWDLYLII